MNDITKNAKDAAAAAVNETPDQAAATPAGEQANTDSANDVGAGPSLEMQLAEAKAEAAKNLDGWQRAAAEFANYRKRIDKESRETYSNATVDTLKRILPIIDDFDRAIQYIPADKTNDVAFDGFKQIHRKLLGLLESAGVKVINPVGEPFNPDYHEAIGQDEGTGKASGTVTTVLQKGYVHGDKILRAAMVRVAS
jgi:molecular chaperone GrpE